MKKDQYQSTSLLIKSKDFLRSIEQAVGIHFITSFFKQFLIWFSLIFWGGSIMNKGNPKILIDKLTKVPLSFSRWLSVTKKTTKILLEIYPIVWKHYSNFGDILTEEEQYHHYRWMEKSKQIMLRDCYICKHCGKAKTHLQVFPVYTDKNKCLWELDDDGLETVCDHCLDVLKKDNNHKKITGKLGFLWSSGKLDVSTLNF